MFLPEPPAGALSLHFWGRALWWRPSAASLARLESASRPASTPPVRPRLARPAATALLAILPSRRTAHRIVQTEGAQISARQIARQLLHVELVLAPVHPGGPHNVLEASEDDIARQRQVEAERRIGRGFPLLEQTDELRGEAPQHLARLGLRIAARGAHLPQPDQEQLLGPDQKAKLDGDQELQPLAQAFRFGNRLLRRLGVTLEGGEADRKSVV